VFVWSLSCYPWEQCLGSCYAVETWLKLPCWTVAASRQVGLGRWLGSRSSKDWKPAGQLSCNSTWRYASVVTKAEDRTQCCNPEAVGNGTWLVMLAVPVTDRNHLPATYPLTCPAAYINTQWLLSLYLEDAACTQWKRRGNAVKSVDQTSPYFLLSNQHP